MTNEKPRVPIQLNLQEPHNNSDLPNDPQSVRIAELEEKLSQTRAEFAYMLNQLHALRVYVSQIKSTAVIALNSIDIV